MDLSSFNAIGRFLCQPNKSTISNTEIEIPNDSSFLELLVILNFSFSSDYKGLNMVKLIKNFVAPQKTFVQIVNK